MKRITWIILFTFIGLIIVYLGVWSTTLLGKNFLFFRGGNEEKQALVRISADNGFNFIRWTLGSWREKGEAALIKGTDYLDPSAEKRLVLDYLALIGENQQSEQELNQLFAQGEGQSEEAEALSQKLAEQRSEIGRLQPLAEAILEQQTATILAEEGFSALFAPWPPVQMKMTPLPTMLIISPREKIEQRYALPLQAGLTASEREALEQAVREETGLSALVVNIGGLGIYPAMVYETSDLLFLTDTIAHEWAHHWLTLHPLGLRYGSDEPHLRTINETVASIFGNEIGRLTLERYYPEAVPTPSTPAEESAEPPPPQFDFREEMHITRIETDRLLAEGKIAEAEAYMEQRRQRFVENGYALRKINQAYFAFHGAYADSPGAAGADPVGPAVIAVRQKAATLYQFMEQVAQIKQLSDLETLNHEQ